MTASKTILDAETDARFWSQTGYKPGQKLDPKNPADKAMIRVWMDILAKIKAEDAHGALVLTYNHPSVEGHLAVAAAAHGAAVGHIDAAMHAPDSTTAAAHVVAASQAATAAQVSTAHAAAYQPPTVSPAVAQTAAAEVAAAAAQPAPTPLRLPGSHPAHGAKAQPNPAAKAAEAVATQTGIVQPDAVWRAMDGSMQGAGARAPSTVGRPGAQKKPTAPEDNNVRELRGKIAALVKQTYGGSFHALFDAHNTGGHADRAALIALLEEADIGNAFTRGMWADGIMDRVDVNHDGFITWDEFADVVDPATPVHAEDHLAVQQAKASPAKAAHVYEVAQQMPPPVSAIPTGTIAQIRDEAKGIADAAAADQYVAILMDQDGAWQHTTLPSRDALDGWYGTITDNPESFRYAAAFDHAAPGDPHEPVAEMFGTGAAIPVTVTVDRPPAPDPSPQLQQAAAKAATPQVVEKIVEVQNKGALAALGAVAVTAGLAVFAGRKRKGRR